MSVMPGNINPSLFIPVIAPELKYPSKFISIKIINIINTIYGESKNLFIFLLYQCAQLVPRFFSY